MRGKYRDFKRSSGYFVNFINNFMKLYYLNQKNFFKDEPRDAKNALMDLSVDDSCLKFANLLGDKHGVLHSVECTFSLSVIFCKEIVYKLWSINIFIFIKHYIKTYTIDVLFTRLNIFRIIVIFKSFKSF